MRRRFPSSSTTPKSVGSSSRRSSRDTAGSERLVAAVAFDLGETFLSAGSLMVDHPVFVGDRAALLAPAAEAADHRVDVGIAHLPGAVGRERPAGAAAAVKN